MTDSFTSHGTSVYASLTNLPIVANEGDIAITEDDGSIYQFLNGFGDPTYSWMLDNNVSNKISLKENIQNSLDSFHISFWNFTSNANGSSYFNINLKNQDSSISAGAQTLLMNNENIISVKPISPLDEAYPSSLRFNDETYIRSDSTFSNYDSAFKSFTVEGWFRNKKTGFSNLINSEAVASVEGSLLLKNRKATLHGRDWEFSNLSDANFKLDSWEHFAYTYDGYDFKYFKNGTPDTGTFDNNFEYTHGTLSTGGLQLTRDAGFQAKVYFASTSSNHDLFQVGSGTTKTKLHLDSGTLKLECSGLTASTTSFPADNAFHIVAWDYKVDTKRIRLFIDGVLKATAVGSPWVINQWGNKEVEGISDFGLVEAASITKQDVVFGNEKFYYGAGRYTGTYDTPMNFTEVIDGNLYVSSRLNYGPAYVAIGASGTTVGNRHVMDPHSNDIYYFEMSWPLADKGYWWYDTARLSFNLFHASWDGSNPTFFNSYSYNNYYNHIYEYDAWGRYSSGRLRKRYRSQYDNTTQGFFAGGTVDHVVRGSNIYSVFIDFSNSRFIIFRNGVCIEQNSANLQNLGSRVPDGGGVILAVQERDRWTTNLRRYFPYSEKVEGEGTPPGGSYAEVYTPYDTRRPEAKAKISFNSNDWFYDPSELHIQHTQAKAAGTEIGARRGNIPLVETLNTISSPNMYARSANHNDWMKDSNASVGSDSAYPNDLRYFPQCFEELNGKMLTIGGDAVIQNPNSETGLSYAQAYVAQTGGTLRTVDANVLASYSNNLRTYIDNSLIVNGDAIYLQPGTYACSQSSNFNNQGIHNLKKVLICGSDTRQVKINYNSDRNRYFGLIFGKNSDNNTQLAFLTLNRTSSTISKNVDRDSLFFGSTGGKAYKVTFDFNNKSFTFLNDRSAKKTSVLTIENCHFKNYSVNTIASSGYMPALKLINNTFEKEFFNAGNSVTTSHVLIGFNKSNMNKYSDSSETIFGALLDGHMKNFMFQSGIQRDSNFIPPTSVSDYDSITSDILIETSIGYRDLLRVNNDGVIYAKSIEHPSTNPSVSNAWVFNEINYDGSAFTIKQNGVLSYSSNDLFDSHSLDSCEINWGFYDSYDVVTDQYVTQTPQKADLIHELLVDNNVRTYSSVPIDVRPLQDSFDNHYSITFNTSIPSSDSIVDVAGSLIGVQAGPYVSGSRAWFKQGAIGLGYDSISKHILYDYAGNPYDSAIIATYPDSIVSSDLVGDPFDVTVDFTGIDDVGNQIRWNVDNIQNERRVRIGYDSIDGGKFLLRQYRDSSLDKDRTAAVLFTAELVNRNADSLPLFKLDVDGTYLTPAASNHTVTYHYLAVDVGEQASPYHLQRMTTQRADSSINDSDYIFIGDSGLSTSLIELYDSLGDLP